MKRESMLEAATRLSAQHTNAKDLVLAIREFIFNHANSLPKSERKEPRTIIESRFISAQEAFDSGMLSCGALSNIAAEMLRHANYKIKLIHGENEKSVDHAWISVFDPQEHTWTEYDLVRPRADIPNSHIKKLEVDSWEDIRKQIESDHYTMVERRKKRGLPIRSRNSES